MERKIEQINQSEKQLQSDDKKKEDTSVTYCNRYG